MLMTYSRWLIPAFLILFSFAAAACESDYYQVTLTDTTAIGKKVKLTVAASEAGGFSKLLDRDEADRKALLSDPELTPEIKRRALAFLDSNIRNVRCYRALQ